MIRSSSGHQKETTPDGCCLFFGGLEGDRTLEPHGCEPCALPSGPQILLKYRCNSFKEHRKIRKKGTNDDEFVFPCFSYRKRCVFSTSKQGGVSHAPDLRGTSVKLNEIKGPFLRSIVKAAFLLSEMCLAVRRDIITNQSTFAISRSLNCISFNSSM